MRSFINTSILCFFIATSVANANDWSNLTKKKQTTLGLYMTPQQAFDTMKKDGDNTLFVDVRTREEVNFLGMPTVADANIPYMKLNEWFSWNQKKKNFEMEVNSDFSDVVIERIASKQLNKDSKIIFICRSGSRSAKAADLLAKLGYTNVHSITEGFEGDKAKKGNYKGQRVVNGWKNTNLPWSYKLVKTKMYEVGS